MQNVRLDHRLKALYSHHSGLCRHLNGVTGAWRLALRDLYRFTAEFLAIQKSDQRDEFLQHIADRQQTLDAWLDQHFAPAEAIGFTRRELFRLIEEGVSESEFLRDHKFAGVRKRIQAPETPAQVDLEAPTKPPRDEPVIVDVDAMTEAERVAYYARLSSQKDDEITYLNRLLEAARAEIRQWRRDSSRLVNEIEDLRRQIQALLRKASRDLAGSLPARRRPATRTE